MSKHQESRGSQMKRFIRPGVLIRQFRKEKGLLQRELATLSGVSEASVKNWESGKFDPTIQNTIRLSKALGKSVDDFFDQLNTDAPFKKGDRVVIKLTYKKLLKYLVGTTPPRGFVDEFIAAKGKILTVDEIEMDIVPTEPWLIKLEETWFPVTSNDIEEAETSEIEAFDLLKKLKNQGGQG